MASPGWPSRQEVDGGAGTEPRLVRAESAQLPEALLFTPFNIRTIQWAGAGDWEAFSSPSLPSASLLLPHLRSWHRMGPDWHCHRHAWLLSALLPGPPAAGRVQFSLAPRRNPQPSRRLLCPSQPSPPRAHIWQLQPPPQCSSCFHCALLNSSFLAQRPGRSSRDRVLSFPAPLSLLPWLLPPALRRKAKMPLHDLPGPPWEPDTISYHPLVPRSPETSCAPNTPCSLQPSYLLSSLLDFSSSQTLPEAPVSLNIWSKCCLPRGSSWASLSRERTPALTPPLLVFLHFNHLVRIERLLWGFFSDRLHVGLACECVHTSAP